MATFVIKTAFQRAVRQTLMNTEQRFIIGFDAKRIMRNGTGLGSYGRTLINALAAEDASLELRLYAPDEGNEALRTQLTTADNIVPVYPQQAHSALAKAWWRSKGVVKDLKRDGVTLFHGLSGELPLGIKAAGIRTLVTVHDLIFMRHPEFYHAWDVFIYIRKFRRMLKEADRIVAISECTKRDIVELGDFPADRIDVIYQSCGTRFKQPVSDVERQEVVKKYALPPRYMLCVGTIEARKNVLLAVKALPHLPEDLHLVILGRPTKYAETVKKWVEKHTLTSRVHFLHGVPNNDLPTIYRSAEVFVYPSRYEGFGLPIIEAIQSELPVVACTGSCLEEAGGPDSLYVGPDDVEGLAHAVSRVLKSSDERSARITRSLQYIRCFENSDIARRMLEEYERVHNDY